MSALRLIRDGLANIMTGAGTSADKRMHGRYMLAPLSQADIDAMYRTSWLMRKVVDLPPKDMTRAGRDWQADKADIEKLEKEELKHQLWAKLRRALILGRLGGGAIIIGANGNPSQLLDPTKVGPNALRYLFVCSRWHLTLGSIVTDLEDPLFGQPQSYQLNSGRGTNVPIHPSRVIPFKGLPIADVGLAWGSQDWFWGDSILQSVQDAVRNADMAQGGFASLIDEAKNDVIRVPDLMASVGSAEYEARFMKRLELAQIGKSTHRATVLDKDEEWEQRQITWNGMPDIIRVYLSIVAGAADIPATRLLGKSADGMNATGEGDDNNYWTMIEGLQKSDLQPALDIIDPMLAGSAGVQLGEAWSLFAPLRQLSEEKLATINKTKADTIKVYSDGGLVPTIALEKAVQNMLTEDGWLPGLDQALDELPDDERFPSTAEPDPNMADPNAIDPLTGKGGDQRLRLVANDATPRSLYVRRDVINVADLKAWAKAQGLPELQDGLYVTLIHSRTLVDWMKIDGEWSNDDKGQITIAPGGVRIVEPLGDRSAVLLFTSSTLSWRHESIVRAGASHDYDDYQPHISLTKEPVDLTNVEPYRGKIVLGPEIFEEVRP
jgi:phage-related protein (TIGR01555 family)